MRKIYCDKCGNEIDERNSYFINIRKQITSEDYRVDCFELCSSCRNQILKQMKR